MKKALLLSLCLILLGACKQEEKKNDAPIIPLNKAFEKMLETYYEDGLKLYPLNATFEGDNRYNDTLPNFLTDQFKAKELAHYTAYKEELLQYGDDV